MLKIFSFIFSVSNLAKICWFLTTLKNLHACFNFLLKNVQKNYPIFRSFVCLVLTNPLYSPCLNLSAETNLFLVLRPKIYNLINCLGVS